MARIKVKMNKLDTTLNKAFKEFIISKTAAGIKEETLKSYNRHFITVGKYLDLDMKFSELTTLRQYLTIYPNSLRLILNNWIGVRNNLTFSEKTENHIYPHLFRSNYFDNALSYASVGDLFCCRLAVYCL